jgi:hypothetical protein
MRNFVLIGEQDILIGQIGHLMELADHHQQSFFETRDFRRGGERHVREPGRFRIQFRADQSERVKKYVFLLHGYLLSMMNKQHIMNGANRRT